MPDAPTPASPNFEKLKAKLRELFELDKADLDFGIYRILRQRHVEITEFLDKHLERTVREALTSHGSLQQAQVEGDLHKAESAAHAAGIAPEQSPVVMELRAKSSAGPDLDATADEAYSHLLTFFSRYYQEGDFLGLQRSTVHGREKYMIPYNGEEVKLVWANMDQYYIKSSELLRDYRFRVEPDAGTLLPTAGTGTVTVHFKLVEGDTEKDNRKPDGKTTRVFALDQDPAFEEVDATTLCIRFRYREHAAERNLQDRVSADTEKTLADNLPPRWKAILFTTDPTYRGKDKKDTRTVLQKHLRAYTARHQFDYFIHKDLGGFLRRELDFYIKNEVMHLDDIESAAAPKAEEYLSKIRAVRRCAVPVIRMLAQLEDFQKKLWLKKKFVVETRYCMTLDRVPEALYPEICANDTQWAEWEALYAISDTPKDLLSQPPRTPAFLKAQPHLMLDTRHFDRAFTLKLLAAVDNLDDSLDGVCFHSENFQALQLLQDRHREQMKCVYIDPPYNTDASAIIYKNNYKHSSWMSLVEDRLSLASRLMATAGVICFAVDDEEVSEARYLLSQLFAKEIGIAAVRSNPQSRKAKGTFSPAHEYALFYGKAANSMPGSLELTEKRIARYPKQDEKGRFAWMNFIRTGTNDRRADRPRLYYPIFVAADNTLRIPDMTWSSDVGEYGEYVINEALGENESAVFPVVETDDGHIEKRWHRGHQRVTEEPDEYRARRDSEGHVSVDFKTRMDESSTPVTWWDNNEYASANYGAVEMKALFGAKPFDFPKALNLVADCLRAANAKVDSVILDFFAGSGTTGHAVINLNREDDGQRNYILTEMGDYFDAVLVPRLKKVVYSTDWKDGKPQSRNTGISHAFKIVRLESYEDTLNNLHLRRTPEQDAALQKADEWQRDEYMLGYFLDVESAGSASLLDVGQLRDPFRYQLQIATRTAGETKPIPVDLVETFNWLIGLKVKHIDHQKGFLSVTGEQRAGGRVLILWRTLGDDAKADNVALERYLAKIAVNPADTEYDFIYVNGSHTLPDPHNKVHLIEEELQRRMFESETFERLSND